MFVIFLFTYLIVEISNGQQPYVTYNFETLLPLDVSRGKSTSLINGVLNATPSAVTGPMRLWPSSGITWSGVSTSKENTGITLNMFSEPRGASSLGLETWLFPPPHSSSRWCFLKSMNGYCRFCVRNRILSFECPTLATQSSTGYSNNVTSRLLLTTGMWNHVYVYLLSSRTIGFVVNGYEQKISLPVDIRCEMKIITIISAESGSPSTWWWDDTNLYLDTLPDRVDLLYKSLAPKVTISNLVSTRQRVARPFNITFSTGGGGLRSIVYIGLGGCNRTMTAVPWTDVSMNSVLLTATRASNDACVCISDDGGKTRFFVPTSNFTTYDTLWVDRWRVLLTDDAALNPQTINQTIQFQLTGLGFNTTAKEPDMLYAIRASRRFNTTYCNQTELLRTRPANLTFATDTSAVYNLSFVEGGQYYLCFGFAGIGMNATTLTNVSINISEGSVKGQYITVRGQITQNQILANLSDNILPQDVNVTDPCPPGWLLPEHNMTVIIITNRNTSGYAQNLTNATLSRFEGFYGRPCNATYFVLSPARIAANNSLASFTFWYPLLTNVSTLLVGFTLSSDCFAAQNQTMFFPVVGNQSLSSIFPQGTSTGYQVCVMYVWNGMNSSVLAASPTYGGRTVLVSAVKQYTTLYSPMYVNRSYSIIVQGTLLPSSGDVLFLAENSTCVQSVLDPVSLTVGSDGSRVATFLSNISSAYVVCYFFSPAFNAPYPVVVFSSSGASTISSVNPPEKLIATPTFLSGVLNTPILDTSFLLTNSQRQPYTVVGDTINIKTYLTSIRLRLNRKDITFSAPAYVIKAGQSQVKTNGELIVRADGYGTALISVVAYLPDSSNLSTILNVTLSAQCDAATTCSGHGYCVAEGCVCYQNFSTGFWGSRNCGVCSDEYYGATCQKHCSIQLCSGKGFCDSSGQCSCFPRHTGPQCSRCVGGYAWPGCRNCTQNFDVKTCTLYCDPQILCSSHGFCVPETRACRCFVGYYGSDCSKTSDCSATTQINPIVASIQDYGTSIDLFLASDLYATIGSCRDVLDDVSDTWAQSCAAISTTLIRITSPNGPPGKTINVRTSTCSKTFTQVPVNRKGLWTTTPSASLKAPTVISSCAGVTLDASDSRSSGGSLTMSFTATKGPTITQLNSFFTANVRNQSQVSVPASLLPPGSTTTFVVRVTNVWKEFSTATVTVMKYQGTEPADGSFEVQFLTPVVIVRPRESLRPQVVVTTSVCARSLPTDLLYTWSLVTALGATVVLPTTTTRVNYLDFAAFTFEPWKAPYILSVTIFEENNPVRSTQAQATIKVPSCDLSVAISQSQYTVGNVTYAAMSATVTDDNMQFSTRPEPVRTSYQWTCSILNSGEPCPFSLSASANPSPIILPVSNVTIIAFVVSVQVDVATRGVLAEIRTATGSTTVSNRIAATSDSISAVPSPESTDSTYLSSSHEGIIQLRSGRRAQWSVTGMPELGVVDTTRYHLDVSRLRPFSSVLIKAVSLTDNSTYFGSIGVGDTISAQLTVATLQAVGLVTSVTIRFENVFAQPSQFPLSFRFGEIDEDMTETPRTKWQSSPTVTFIVLQPRNDGVPQDLRTYVGYVRDRYGTVVRRGGVGIVEPNSTVSIATVLAYSAQANTMGQDTFSFVGLIYQASPSKNDAAALMLSTYRTDSSSAASDRVFFVSTWNESLAITTNTSSVLTPALQGMVSPPYGAVPYFYNERTTLDLIQEMGIKMFQAVTAQAKNNKRIQLTQNSQRLLSFENLIMQTAFSLMYNGYQDSVFWMEEFYVLECGITSGTLIAPSSLLRHCVVTVPGSWFGLSQEYFVTHFQFQAGIPTPPPSITIKLASARSSVMWDNSTCLLWVVGSDGGQWDPSYCVRINRTQVSESEPSYVTCRCEKWGYFAVMLDPWIVYNTTPAPPLPPEPEPPYEKPLPVFHGAVAIGSFVLLYFIHMLFVVFNAAVKNETVRTWDNSDNILRLNTSELCGVINDRLIKRPFAVSPTWKLLGYIPSISVWAFFFRDRKYSRGMLYSCLYFVVSVHLIGVYLAYSSETRDIKDNYSSLGTMAITIVVMSCFTTTLLWFFRCSVVRVQNSAQNFLPLVDRDNNYKEVKEGEAAGGGEHQIVDSHISTKFELHELEYVVYDELKAKRILCAIGVEMERLMLLSESQHIIVRSVLSHITHLFSEIHGTSDDVLFDEIFGKEQSLNCFWQTAMLALREGLAQHAAILFNIAILVENPDVYGIIVKLSAPPETMTDMIKDLISTVRSSPGYWWVSYYADRNGKIIDEVWVPSPVPNVEELLCLLGDCVSVHTTSPAIQEELKALQNGTTTQMYVDQKLWWNACLTALSEPMERFPLSNGSQQRSIFEARLIVMCLSHNRSDTVEQLRKLCAERDNSIYFQEFETTGKRKYQKLVWNGNTTRNEFLVNLLNIRWHKLYGALYVNSIEGSQTTLPKLFHLLHNTTALSRERKRHPASWGSGSFLFPFVNTNVALPFCKAGDTVVLCSGHHSPLHLSNIHCDPYRLHIVGHHDTFITTAPPEEGSSGLVGLRLAQCSGVVLRGITVEGSQCGVFTRGCNDILMMNVKFKNVAIEKVIMSAHESNVNAPPEIGSRVRMWSQIHARVFPTYVLRLWYAFFILAIIAFCAYSISGVIRLNLDEVTAYFIFVGVALAIYVGGMHWVLDGAFQGIHSLADPFSSR